jgi:hypothetical protein
MNFGPSFIDITYLHKGYAYYQTDTQIVAMSLLDREECER